MTDAVLMQNLMQGKLVVALHEAGHVVGDLWSGLPFRYVTIRPRREGMGGVVQTTGRMADPQWIAVGTLTGPMAEALWLERSRQAEGDPHAEFTHILSEEILGEDEETCRPDSDCGILLRLIEEYDLDEDWLCSMAERIVRRHWSVIEKIALELMRRNTLQYAEAKRIYDECVPANRRRVAA